MDDVLIPVDQKLQSQATTIAEQQHTIEGLQQQLKDCETVSLYGIQSTQPEVLWYEARSQGAPHTGPHGIVNLTLGEPTIADFHPVVLEGGSSDNVYLLRREYYRLSEEQKVKMETATEFDIGCEVSLDPLPNVQAFEWDYQIRRSNGVVINIGLQLLPNGTLRGFDFNGSRGWVALGQKIAITTGQKTSVRVFSTCDDKIVQFTHVIENDISLPVTFSHPVSKTNVINRPYLNAAYQLDGRPDAKPYKAQVGHLSVNFG